MGDEQQSKKPRPSQPTSSGVQPVPKAPAIPKPGVRLEKGLGKGPASGLKMRSEPKKPGPKLDEGSSLPPVEIDVPPTEPPKVSSLPPKDEASTARPEAKEPDRKERDREASIRISVPADVTGDLPDAVARFGRFEIVGRLASGGMADLFLARESTEGDGASRHTVIKVIKGEHSEHGEFAKMFLNEGRLAMRLTHPNICTVYECGREDGRYFMAMEYVHGRTLRDVLVRAGASKQKIDVPVVLKLFSIIAEALDFAHRARDAKGQALDIVHRDVSPQNVMIRYDGVVKLLDFGVAKAARSSHQTESGALKGKFSYMSPEQALGDPLDARADIFSLGVVLFECVTGRRLFHRKAQYDTLKAILETDPPALGTYRDDVPDGLDEVLGKALAKRADERYQHAADFQHDLESLLAKSGEVVSTSRIAALMQDLFGDAAHQLPELDTGPEVTGRFAPIELPPEPKPNWMPVAAIGLAVVVLMGGLVFALSGGDETETTTDPPGTDNTVQPVVELPVEPPELPPVDPPPEDPPTEIESPIENPPNPETPPEDVISEPDDTQSSGRRRRRRRGGGTVIVTDPGF